MKKAIICLCLLTALLLCACTAQPEQTDTVATETTQATEAPATTEPQTAATEPTATEPVETEPIETEPVETKPAETQPPATEPPTQKQTEPAVSESVYETYATDEPEGTVLGVVYNEPYDGKEPTPSVTWIEGEYERAYVIPKTAGSTVALYALIGDAEGNLTREEVPSYVVVNCKKDCVIYGSFPRPEGYSAFYLEITDPDGNVGGYEMSYNGNTGTPIREYIVAEPAS